jgi:hypothetical protein
LRSPARDSQRNIRKEKPGNPRKNNQGTGSPTRMDSQSWSMRGSQSSPSGQFKTSCSPSRVFSQRSPRRRPSSPSRFHQASYSPSKALDQRSPRSNRQISPRRYKLSSPSRMKNQSRTGLNAQRSPSRYTQSSPSRVDNQNWSRRGRQSSPSVQYKTRDISQRSPRRGHGSYLRTDGGSSPTRRRYRYSQSSVSDPDPHGSALNLPPGSGSAFRMRIRIQQLIKWAPKAKIINII